MAGNLTAMIAAIYGISAAIPDPYFEYTTLLLPGNGTNGAQNNSFLDTGNPAEFTASITGTTMTVTAVASGTIKVGVRILGSGVSLNTTITAFVSGTSGGVGVYTVSTSQTVSSTTITSDGFPITRNGTPMTQGTFSPFSQTGWGNYFNGSSSLTPSSGSFLAVGTNNYTIEFWVYLTANAAANHAIAINATNGLVIVLGPTKTSLNQFSVGDIVATGSGLSINTWHHVAIVRSGTGSNQTAIYIDGVRDTVGTDATNWTATGNPRIGGNTASQYITGYLSNIRVVNSAIYSGTNITVPISPLSPSQYAGTTFLTCQNNRFLDNGSTQATFTANGSPTVVAFSPFNPTASWSAATYGGSGYFDGSGDYLTTPNVTALNLYNTTNTVECWVYPLSFSTQFQLYGTDFDGTYYTLFEILDTSGYPRYISRNGTAITGSSGIKLNQWNHVAFGRSGSTQSIWVNGIRVASGTITTEDQWGTAVITIGRFNAASRGNGYLSSLRVVKGTDVYGVSNTTITVPTAPLTAITNTSLLLNFTNAGIYDATSKNDLETVGNAQISNTTAQFGSTSIKFDGTGDWLKGNQATTDLYTFSGDFTIETWVYSTSSASVNLAYPTIFGSSAYNSSGIGLKIQSSGGAGTTGCACVWYNNTQILTGTSNIADSVWHHVAVTRSGSTIRLFVDGTQQTSATNSSTFTCASGYPLVAADASSAGTLTGYLQDLRITKGYARYTANFTPPTAAFPTL